MLDKDKLEKALLVGVIKRQSWDTLILNNLTRDCFSKANVRMYDYIKEFVDENKYPDIRVFANVFDLDDVTIGEYLQIGNLDEVCTNLHNEYIKDQLKYKVGQLNEYVNELETNPTSYIDRIAGVVDDMRLISYHTKSVGLFDNIDDIFTIDKNDVIKTGFIELDERLIGWKRGEELVVLVGRTGQGKSWLGLKFALAGAMQNERVGIYSGEMSQYQLQERILCCAKPEITSSKEEAREFLRDKQIPDIRLITQKELRRRATVNDIEEFIIRDRLTMVVIDQLSLMEDVTSKPRNTIKTSLWKYIYGLIFFIL